MILVIQHRFELAKGPIFSAFQRHFALKHFLKYFLLKLRDSSKVLCAKIKALHIRGSQVNYIFLQKWKENLDLGAIFGLVLLKSQVKNGHQKFEKSGRN